MRAVRVASVVSVVLVLAGAALLAAPTAARAGDPVWLTSWDDALARAKTSGKPVLVFFTGSDWCGWCVKLKSEVFDTPEFAAWAETRVVLLVVDFPHRPPQPREIQERSGALMKRLGAEGLPAVVFVTPDGAPIAVTGYLYGGPSVWLKSADAALAKR